MMVEVAMHGTGQGKIALLRASEVAPKCSCRAVSSRRRSVGNGLALTSRTYDLRKHMNIVMVIDEVFLFCFRSCYCFCFCFRFGIFPS